MPSAHQKPAKRTDAPNGALAEAPPSYQEVANQPPSYQAVPDQSFSAPLPEITFAGNALSSQSKDPSNKNYGFDVTESCCLAHLKLLHAIEAMKQDVGYTDGLWGIWDSLVLDGKGVSFDSSEVPSDMRKSDLTGEEEKKMMLSKLREKRWAIFVARAVDRYEAWWNAQDIKMLSEGDTTTKNGNNYMRFPSTNQKLDWQPSTLPPLDVLMVMHTHMLNPRAFLEDTMRYGLNKLWATGLPWELINKAIADDFTYRAADDTQAAWVAKSQRNWHNQDDSQTKSLQCPYCRTWYQAPWTTCGTDESGSSYRSRDLIGEGYGDGKFTFSCTSCGRENYKELLSVSKFLHDSDLLVANGVPMPGTILNPQSGRPEQDPVMSPTSNGFARTFPNRMTRKFIINRVTALFRPGGDHQHPTMDTIKLFIEEVMQDNAKVREIDDFRSWRRGKYGILPNARLSTRKMMSRYWDNFSPFALDLCGAVMRQGIFVDKMVQLDWLHSPSARDTMQRLIQKYQRFLEIMVIFPGQTIVPTLDVDLAWHTHQLHPQSYYQHTVRKTGKMDRQGKFIDHDDKIDESKLGEAFIFTTKTYQDMYGEVYSECTCWYCETVRSSFVSSMSATFRTKEYKLLQSFCTPEAAKLYPPDNSAHVSAHNAVSFASIASATERARQARHAQKIEEEYKKAQERAAKKGRQLPPKDEYYNHWGYSYYGNVL
ncbi:hypothetical protein CCM_03246 [Cordyceps militaris CM01]|uniref:Alpha-ketoglutarate-dependent sulfonate dioxygenase n=1 Tax=Cordyceps militaris (strain CM01) TaxID=983644 RepID=G3J9Q1_CORMM|nr:uncharacterized protein CCM_03246 [Cordyceps militaris CM01]EGX94974.1 hypothetical protein CCM_03246 [Cordyceps militaris CM01]